ncbi:urokinase plasminogen activator surface receptor [Takifugu rubripes]|uniref:urokinase plasminogen activator surface receptor n=1 Tax=Takifugu rubripes TaxID=31033 RepID=UPI0005D1FA05|nr:urokinase plasminogen activator surface receptor [Takifugu rubripes]|eukprot:XP_003966053.2 PREDICTED: ly6/PLAUR domain-containing protein 3 [Takifugu rubripes]
MRRNCNSPVFKVDKMHLLVLVFGIVLLPKAYTLNCNKCVPGPSGTCTSSEKACPSSKYLCGAMRIVSFVGGSKLADIPMKSCFLPEECVESSVNFGLSRIVISIACCKSDLCNTQHAPEPSKSVPNGKKCYHCNGQTCTATLPCQGSEDYCISKPVTREGKKIMVKGCATKQICSNVINPQIKAAIDGEISCCQGDYCNSAISTSASLLLLVAPLISFVMFS